MMPLPPTIARRQEGFNPLAVDAPNFVPKRLIRQIAEEVAAREGLSMTELFSSCRKRKFVQPRQEVMGRAWESGQYTLHQIAAFMGCDHTNVVHARNRWAERQAR